MDWAQIVTQAGLVFLKEGLNFVFSSFKDKKAAQQAQDQQEVKAKEDAAQSVAQEHPKVVPPPAPGLRLDKVATLLWLGNDLMWIQDMMYRGALPERVLQGVRHALRHVQDLGFASASAPVQNLTFCTDILESLVGIQGTALKEVALLQQHDASVEHYVTMVKWFLDAVTKANEPGFQKQSAA